MKRPNMRHAYVRAMCDDAYRKGLGQALEYLDKCEGDFDMAVFQIRRDTVYRPKDLMRITYKGWAKPNIVVEGEPDA